jgi:class 3 adenylate cyclase
MDDLRAVMDVAGAERAVVFGSSEGGALAILFAATYPDRVSALVLYGAYPRLSCAPDYPNGLAKELCDAALERFDRRWGRIDPDRLRLFHPTGADDPVLQESMARWERLSASPGAAVALMRMIHQIDVRHLLPLIHVPALVVYRTADFVHAEGSRYLAAHIPGAKEVELAGDIYMPHLGDQDAILDEIEEFLTGVRPVPQPDRVLATVLYTDIVRSTQMLTKLGDRQWRELLERHQALSDGEIKRHRGRLVKSTGDGVLATFDGPARAVRCAAAIRDAVKGLGLEIRAGLHTGEIEMLGDDVGGIAVHLGQRVSAIARSGEVLVSSTVVDLVAGSDLSFEDRGEQTLKGVERRWRLFALAQ